MRGLKWAKLACLTALAAAPLASGQIVISQIYGGGGNSGATYTNDFIELYNKGATAVDLTGWAVQYASATGTSWNPDQIAGTIAPGGYFLIQLAGGANGSALPTPDYVSTGTPTLGIINMAAGSGKIALTNTSVQLPATTCTGTIPSDPSIVDFVGWGTGSCYEGTGAAPTVSGNANALFRASSGCTDSNNNASDFSVAAVAPRNSLSPTFACPSHTAPSGVGSTDPASVCPGSQVTLFLAVTPGANPPSTGIAVNVDTTNIGGFGFEPMYDDGTHGDVTAGDNLWTTTATVFVSGPTTRSLNCSITDAQGGVGAATISVNVLNANPGGFATATPAGLCPGESTLITVSAHNGCSTSGALTVSADLSAAGGSAFQNLFDDGTNGDTTAGDGVFSYLFTPATGLAEGPHALTATVTDSNNNVSNTLSFSVTTAATCTDSSSTVVISQVYGGGGNSGATLTNDFIELFNRGTQAVSLDGWSVQYASGQDDANGFGVPDATGPRLTTLSGFILPGHYYLVQEAAGSGGTQALPTPDATGSIALSSSRGAIALVNGTAALGLDCANASIMDMVGYGNGTTPASQGFCHEGAFLAGTLSNTVAAIRRDAGCHDVDNNGVDFNVDVPAPRNSASPSHSCASAPVCCLNDYNGDGSVGTDSDISDFFSCLGGNCCATCPPNADFNCDGNVGTDQDIEAFFRVLGGGAC